jgi:AcrR family transcriptional regulator
MPKLIDHGERRQQLAEAAWRVIVRDGVGCASVRTVAAEAGCSPGSLRHVFSTQSELLVFALELVIERVTVRIDALPAAPTARANVESVAAQLLPLDRERRAEMEVYLALFTAANTHSELRETRDAAHRTVRQACRWMIGELDSAQELAPGTDHELEALRLHALIDGLAAHLLYEPQNSDTRWAQRVLSNHIRTLTTSGRSTR